MDGQESGGYILSANSIGGPNNNNNSQQALQSLLEDAKNLVLGLRNRDSAVDTMLSKGQALHETVHTIKDYQSDISDLNGCHQKPRSGLVHSLQQENKQIRHLREENRELKLAVRDHQAVMKVLMDQHRAQTKKLKNLAKLQRFTETGCLSLSPSSSSQASSEQAFGDFATVFTSCLKKGEDSASKDDEELDLLQQENDALRSLLGISQSQQSSGTSTQSEPSAPQESPNEASDEPNSVSSEDDDCLTPTPSTRNSPPPFPSPNSKLNKTDKPNPEKLENSPTELSKSASEAPVPVKTPPATPPKPSVPLKNEASKSKTPSSEKAKSVISPSPQQTKSQTGTMKKATSTDGVKNHANYPSADKKPATPSKAPSKTTVSKTLSNSETATSTMKKSSSTSPATSKTKSSNGPTKSASNSKIEDSKKAAGPEVKTKPLTTPPPPPNNNKKTPISKAKGKSVEEKNETKENQVKKSNSFANAKISVKPAAQKAK